MPKYVARPEVPLDRTFHSLADLSRRTMVERLARGPASVTELARPFDMALPTVVQHLGVLESAGIVTSTKLGRVRTYQLIPAALAPAAEWLGRQRLPAEHRLDRLGAYLESGSNSTDRPPTKPVSSKEKNK
jgi:DNA-binding transcriptional ArsR family regulator